MIVSFLGPKTSFSHEAAIKAFPNAILLESHSIYAVFSDVSGGKANAGVVPIENSTEGVVSATLDMLLSNDLVISGEVFIDVVHYFLARRDSGKIRRIYSHQQAFAQCRQWLQRNYPDVELVSESSTAKAAAHAARLKGSAAIASEKTAKKYKLKVLADNIQDLDFNKTRFVVINNRSSSSSGADACDFARCKTTMFFALKDRPGALFDCLKGFKDFNINLTRIESRPSKKTVWDYVFFVEFEGSENEKRVKSALSVLQDCSTLIKIVGTYPMAGD